MTKPDKQQVRLYHCFVNSFTIGPYLEVEIPLSCPHVTRDNIYIYDGGFVSQTCERTESAFILFCVLEDVVGFEW